MFYEVASTPTFDKWLKGLKDRQTRNKVLARIDRVRNGNLGDHKPLGKDLFEMRFFSGAGLRIYYTIRNQQIVFLICGGNKSSQNKDIDKARRLLQALE